LLGYPGGVTRSRDDGRVGGRGGDGEDDAPGSPLPQVLGPGEEEVPPRPTWTSKAQYILAQLGFSVGLGNVWRFPYLCHQNGGGAFLLLYLLLLFLLGIPLLFLELAAGQCLRQGSVGVWRSISPRLAGIGLASCLVCVFVALYYNVIIAWSLLYLARSFQHPLPWQSCPNAGPNHTGGEPECALSSPTTYFWYRQTLDVTPEMGVGGGLQPALVGGLLGAWALVGASLLKGIKSSGKVALPPQVGKVSHDWGPCTEVGSCARVLHPAWDPRVPAATPALPLS
uniref:Transporter n=1 Tax=Accipiter nisus TaxID=211598 RepID=A0A8B9NMA8_9AVES